MSDITYDELLRECARIFGFSEDEKFESCKQIIESARKSNGHSWESYHVGCACVAPRIARYIDRNHLKDKEPK